MPHSWRMSCRAARCWRWRGTSAPGRRFFHADSPATYTIIQEYSLPGGGRLYHLDLYRIANSASALAFGVDEFLDDPESVALVEWPARIADILPPGTLRVEIVHLSENERRITVRG